MVHQAVVTEQKIWCPICKEHHRFLRIPTAARLLEVSRRTIYRHIEDGSVHVFKVAGTGHYRVCSGCLLAQHAEPVENRIPVTNRTSETQSVT
jgi:excisionase family DNA binding protein